MLKKQMSGDFKGRKSRGEMNRVRVERKQKGSKWWGRTGHQGGNARRTASERKETESARAFVHVQHDEPV